MADDEIDLDAMLDSALDEEFAAPDAAAEAATTEDSDIDLDAMLDEAMVSAAVDGEGVAAAKKASAAGNSRASGGFGPSDEWLQRKQGRGGGAGGAASSGAGGSKEPFSFLRVERRGEWKLALSEDAQRQADMDKQRPLSRSYRAFYSFGKDEGDIVVHLGSAAATKPAGEASQGDGSGGAGVGAAANGDEGAEGADGIFEDVLRKGVASSGVKNSPVIGEGDYEALDRLKASYLRLVAKDVRARVGKDPDVSADRFPSIVSKILA